MAIEDDDVPLGQAPLVQPALAAAIEAGLETCRCADHLGEVAGGGERVGEAGRRVRQLDTTVGHGEGRARLRVKRQDAGERHPPGQQPLRDAGGLAAGDLELFPARAINLELRAEERDSLLRAGALLPERFQRLLGDLDLALAMLSPHGTERLLVHGA